MRFINKRHNNRKLTKARKNQKGRRGYVPNYITSNYKFLEKYMDELERKQALPPMEQFEKAEKIEHLKKLIKQQEQKIKEHNADF